MKKAIALMVCAGMTAAMFTGCAQSQTSGISASSSGSVSEEKTEDAAAADTAETERTTFTVGFDAEFPPYGYMGDDGEYTGFDLELAQEVCNREGWELVKQPIDWDSKDAELSSGTIDCIWNGFTMNGREDQYTWTEPYIDNSQVFVVPADGGVTDQASLAGLTVGVQKDSSALAALEGDCADLAATFGDMIQYADYNTAFMDLEQGAVDAVAIDIGVAQYEISQKGDGYVILDEYLSTEQYAVGFKLGNEELRDIVQADINAMAEDGTIEKIAEEYSDFGIPDSLCIGK